MHDGNIVIPFPFFLFRLGTLIVGDADLMCCNNTNSLDRLFWIRDVSCGIPVKGKGFSQIWIILGLLAQNGSGCPGQRKKCESN